MLLTNAVTIINGCLMRKGSEVDDDSAYHSGDRSMLPLGWDQRS